MHSSRQRLKRGGAKCKGRALFRNPSTVTILPKHRALQVFPAEKAGNPPKVSGTRRAHENSSRTVPRSGQIRISQSLTHGHTVPLPQENGIWHPPEIFFYFFATVKKCPLIGRRKQIFLKLSPAHRGKGQYILMAHTGVPAKKAANSPSVKWVGLVMDCPHTGILSPDEQRPKPGRRGRLWCGWKARARPPKKNQNFATGLYGGTASMFG